MKKISHVNIIEGEEVYALAAAKDICIEIFGKVNENKIKKNIHADIVYVSCDNKKKIGVDKIRALIKDSLLSPIESKFKVYVIKNAQDMSNQSQNALLKIFENPPDHIIFLMTCANLNQLLPTLVSRSSLIKVEKRYEERDLENRDAELFASFLIHENEYEILKMCSKFLKDREKFINLLECSKLYLIKNYAEDTKLYDINQKLNDTIELINSNVNMNLIACSFCWS
ncbi:MAG: hypothetical protein FWC41_05490 [Firmicutes bacterium]|nr:hypothetical protein [Bacillota bacterium]